METTGTFHPLLAEAEGLRPVLDEGLPAEALREVPDPQRDRSRADVPFLDRRDKDPNDLAAQRWGLVAPEGPEGDALLEAVAPLRELREAEQGAPAKVLRVPKELDAAAAVKWREKAWRSIPEEERPRFLLLLGELDGVSMELQHALAHSAFVGRLAFMDSENKPDLRGYAAYAEKVRRSARAKGGRPEVLLYAAPDETVATALGNRLLIDPCAQALREWTVKRYGRDGAGGESPAAFVNAAKQARGTVLLSLTHGLARGRSSWTPQEQRARQGALKLGRETVLYAEHLRQGPFLAGGMWFALACFSAGTPPRSAFRAWLELLAKSGRSDVDPRSVLENLPRAELGERAFLAALPQAALANPEGPLAVIGHSDLTWAHGFVDPENPYRSRPGGLSSVLKSLARGSRAGVALDWVMELYRDVNDILRVDHQLREEAKYEGHPDPVDPMKHGNLWMLGNDLRGYVLLGDPAVRLETA